MDYTHRGRRGKTTYARFGISYFYFMLRIQCRTRLHLISWGKVRGQLVLCRRNILQTTRGCQLLLSLHFLFAWNDIINTNSQKEEEENPLSSSRSPAIVFRNSSISHLCAFASDSAAFLAKSANSICGFDPEAAAAPAGGASEEALNVVSIS